jgi:Do/DeqQ family serine protease
MKYGIDMKQFVSLLFAAILGSLITLDAYQYLGPDEKVDLNFQGTPTSRVAYTIDENGEAVPLDFTVVAEKVTPAVVFIRSTQLNNVTSRDPIFDFFGQPMPMQRGPSVATGSGVVINKSGYIVTNNHVVGDADYVDVTLSDNRTFRAEVIGTDPDTDIALVKINESNLPFLSFIDSDQTKVGEWVLAIGNPFNLNSTVTAGIISAKGRNINIIQNHENPGDQNTAIESFIQTDAAINPGNSGGALVNLNGGLVGINTAIASNTGSYAGYGFAVPSNIVSKIVEDLIKYGAVQRGWLGVSIGSVNSELAREFDLTVNEGAFVSGFAERSAAKEAGIKEHDVVTKIDNTPIKSSSALIEYIGRHRPGDKVMVTVNRKGKEVTVPVVLKNREGEITKIKPEEREGFASLGFQVEDVEERTLKRLNINNGVIVKSIGSGKLSKYTDIREGFIITKVNEEPVKSAKEFNAIMKKMKAGELIILSGTYESRPGEYNYAFRM